MISEMKKKELPLIGIALYQLLPNNKMTYWCYSCHIGLIVYKSNDFNMKQNIIFIY